MQTRPTLQRRERVRPSDGVPLQEPNVVVGGNHDAERVLVGWLKEVLVAGAVWEGEEKKSGGGGLSAFGFDKRDEKRKNGSICS